jgi:TolA-binding protein
MRGKYTKKMHKGSGFFNMCTGNKCAAESPRKTPKNSTFKVNNPMKSVIKKINSVVNNKKNIVSRSLNSLKNLNRTIEKLEKSMNNSNNSNIISLRKDQIKTLKNLKEALLTKNSKVKSNVLNRSLKKMKEYTNNSN